MTKQRIARILACILTIMVMIQSNMTAVFAFTQNNNQNIESNTRKKDIPKLKDLVNKKPLKIPAGIAKNEDKLEKWKGKKELAEKRTATSKTFDNGDGTFTAVQFFQPIHVKDARGNFVDIDNNLIKQSDKKGSASYKNKRGLFDVTFSNTDNDPAIDMGQGNISVRLVPKEADIKDVSVKDNQIMYGGDIPGIDYLYTVNDSGVKEDIILNHFVDVDTFTYELNVNGPADITEQDGKIQIIDKKTNTTYMTISAPLMRDADGNESDGLSLSLDRKLLGKDTVTLKVDKNWLQDPARVYPVAIDPNIRIRIYQDQRPGDDSIYLPGLEDTYVNSGNPGQNYSDSDAMRVGGFDGNTTRAYLKFPMPAQLTEESNIISSNLNMYATSGSGPVQAYEVVGKSLDVSTVNWNSQPDNDGSHSSRKALSDPNSTASKDQINYYHLYITEAIRDWAKGAPNNGLELVKSGGETTEGVELLAGGSTIPPFVEIIYNEDKPVEGEELELVLERDDIYKNGTAMAKGVVKSPLPASGQNRVTVKYTLMPDNITKTIVEENVPALEWETEKFDLELNKAYWIEAEVKVEDWIQPPPVDGAASPGYYVESFRKSLKTDKFVVGEVQPGDTLKKLAKYYMDDGSKSQEMYDLNKLETDALRVSQKLFAMSGIKEPYNYDQPDSVTPAMELEDANSGSEALNTEMAGQYINSHTGAFTYNQTDFSFQAYNMNLDFTRSYNSKQTDRKSALGDSWDYSFDKYLFFYKDNTIGYNRGDGSRIYFKKSADTYTTTAPTYDVLSSKGDGYEIKTAQNIKYNFSKTGLLTSIVDMNNNTTTVSYDQSDWQTQIKDAVNRTISLEYYNDGDWQGNISKVNLPGAASIKFTYHPGSNNPASFTDAEEKTTNYGYNTGKKLEKVILPKGNTVIRNEYAADGKVLNQYDGESNNTSLSYQDGVTTVTNGRDYAYKYTFNSKYWLTRKEYPDSKYETYIYNNKGDILEITDRKGLKDTYTYNELGYVTSYKRPDGLTAEYGYKNGYLNNHIKDFMGNTTDLYYDANNNLDKVQNYVTEKVVRKTLTTDYNFDSKGLLTSISDPENVTTTYDNSGYPGNQTVRVSNVPVQTLYFDSMGRVITSFDANNNKTSYTYDKNGNTTRVSSPSTPSVIRDVSYTYDDNGNLESETGSRIIPSQNTYATTLYYYDRNDRLNLVKDPYGYPVNYHYDSNGNMDWESDQEGNTTSYSYNKLDWLTEVYYPGQTTPGMKYYYDELGNVTREEEIDGGWTKYSYDYNINKVLSTSRPEGIQTSYVYDLMGNLKTETLPDKTTVAYDYDEMYRTVKVTEPGNTSEISYNGSGNVKEIRDSAGKVYTYSYYPDGRLKTTLESFMTKVPSGSTAKSGAEPTALDRESLAAFLGSDGKTTGIKLSMAPYAQKTGVVSDVSTFRLTSEDESEPGLTEVKYTTDYTYDANGNVLTVKDEQGRTTTYKYNEINQVKEVTDPKGYTQKYEYNEDGNVSKETDGEGNITLTTYDALNRTYTVSIPSEDTEYVYLYNRRGLQNSVIDPMGNTTTYHYDPMGRVSEVIDAKQQKTTYDYHPDGNLRRIGYPNGQNEQYAYDAADRISQYTDRSGVVQTTEYNSIGKVASEYDSVGNRTDYQYDSLARLSQITDVAGRSKIYTYNTMGQVETETGVDGNLTSYQYDPRGRVIEITDPENKKTSIAYNSDNNRLEAAKPGNRYYTYQYDANGNLYKETDPLGNMTEYLYNGNNLPTEIKDARGYSERYTYTGLNQVKTLTDKRGNTTGYDYFPGGNLKTVTDAKGYTTKYTYDSLNQMETITDALNNTARYTYDPMGNVLSIGDPRGVSTTYTYNARDQVLDTIDTQSGTISKTYYPGGDLRTDSDQEGDTTEYSYDILHRIKNVKEANGYEKTYTYNPATGNVDRMSDNAGETTDYTYDKMHRLLSETTEQGLRTTYTYDDFGNLRTKTTPDGNTVTYSYDALDRITDILDPQNNLTQMAYDPMGNIDYIIKPGDLKYDYSYDPVGNLEKTVDPLGQETNYTYDPNNNKATMEDPAGNKYTYTYDALNRLQSVIDLTNNGAGYHYDTSGNMDSYTDGNGYTTSYAYNNLNLLESVTDGEGNTTRYTYYRDGNLKTMTDPRGNTTNYSYDPMGKLSSMTNPLGQTKGFQYTLLGQTDNISKADGNQIDYQYDQYNRLQDIVYPDETKVTYQYDGLNRKISMEDKNGTTKYGYDQMGHLTKVENPTGETVKYEYDQKGRKTKVIYPDGKFVSYSYDKYDRLITITDREGRKTSYTYDNASRKKTISLPNGITTSYEYDKAGRITGILSQKEDGTQVEKYEYTDDKAGNKTVEEIWKEGKHYRRDYTYYKNNTVKEMTESGDNSAYYSYHYDGAGNIDQKTVTEDGATKTYTYTYDSANRMITESQNGKITRTYRYDANGNRIARVISGGDEENSADGAEETAVQATSDSSPLTQDTDETEASAGGGSSNGRKEVIDYFYYDYTDQLEEIVEHNGHDYTYGYDGEGNRLWRTYSQYSVVKPPVDDGERDPKEEPGEFNNGNGKGNGLDTDYGTDNAGKTSLDGDDANKGQGQEKNSNGKDKTSSTQKASPFMFLVASTKDVGLASYNFNLVEHFNLAKNDNNGNGNGNSSDSGSNGNSSNGNGNSGNNNNSNSSNDSGNSGNGGNNGNGSSGNGNSGGSSNNGNGNGSNGNGNSGNDGNKGDGNGSSGNGNSGNNSNPNSGQGLDASDNNKGQGQEKHDKNDKDKDKNKGNKDKGNNGKHLGWYKNKHNPNYIDPETGEEIPGDGGTEEGGTQDGGYDLTNPEIFQVTNYINDLSEENEQVLMTTDVDGNYRGVYTYDNESVERISEEDLGKVEGRPNNPLYYLKDALGTITSITNMNGSIIDSNRFAPYGEALDPVAKNARLTNSPFGYTGESHDIDEDLIYLRARYYEPNAMRFIQQDTYLGDIQKPLSRNLYAYCRNNPVNFIDPSGHKDITTQETFSKITNNGDVCIDVDTNTVVYGIRGNMPIEVYSVFYRSTDHHLMLVGVSYTETKYSVFQHYFTNLGLTVFEAGVKNGLTLFSRNPEDAAVEKANIISYQPKGSIEDVFSGRVLIMDIKSLQLLDSKYTTKNKILAWGSFLGNALVDTALTLVGVSEVKAAGGLVMAGGKLLVSDVLNYINTGYSITQNVQGGKYVEAGLSFLPFSGTGQSFAEAYNLTKGADIEWEN